MYNNGYQQYKQQSVSTMTKGEMLLLLYDECLKRLKVAEVTLDKGDFVNFEAAITRTEDIIRYLSAILNRNYDISRELYRMYDYFLFELGRVKAGRNKEIIAELKKHISELRDAFKEADKTAGSAVKGV